MGNTLRKIVLGGLVLLLGGSLSNKDLEDHKQRKINEQLFLDTVAEYVDAHNHFIVGEKKYKSKLIITGSILSNLKGEVWKDLDFFGDDDSRIDAFEKRDYVFIVFDSVNLNNVVEYLFGKTVNENSSEYEGEKHKVIMFEELADTIDGLLYKTCLENLEKGCKWTERQAFSDGDKIYINLSAIKRAGELMYGKCKDLNDGNLSYKKEAIKKTYDGIMERAKTQEGDEKSLFLEEYIKQRINIALIHEREHLVSSDEERAYLKQLSIMPTHYDLQSILRMYPKIKKEFENEGFLGNEILLESDEKIKDVSKTIYKNRFTK